MLEQIQNKVNTLDSLLKLDYTGRFYDDYEKGTTLRIRSSGNLLIISNSSISTMFAKDGCSRGDIKSLSLSSAARMRCYLRECTSEYKTFITLTYPYGHGFQGGKAKRDLKVFLQQFKAMSADDPLYSTFWFMEFQERGSIHFHLFSTSFIHFRDLSRRWYEICGTEDKRHLASGTNVQAIRSGKQGISRYAAKYAAKSSQKVVPDHFGWVGRFWGVSGVKTRVSADVKITGKVLNNASLIRRLNGLSAKMLELEKAGQIKRLDYSNYGIEVFSISTTEGVATIRSMIALIALLASVNDFIPNFEELGEELGD